MTGLVSVTIMARPRAALSVPSVTRNDGIASCVVSRPLTRPTSAPVPSPASAPTTQELSRMRHGERRAHMPDSASVEATERSICRPMMTNVMPTAMIDDERGLPADVEEIVDRQEPGRSEAEHHQQDAKAT